MELNIDELYKEQVRLAEEYMYGKLFRPGVDTPPKGINERLERGLHIDYEGDGLWQVRGVVAYNWGDEIRIKDYDRVPKGDLLFGAKAIEVDNYLTGHKVVIYDPLFKAKLPNGDKYRPIHDSNGHLAEDEIMISLFAKLGIGEIQTFVHAPKYDYKRRYCWCEIKTTTRHKQYCIKLDFEKILSAVVYQGSEDAWERLAEGIRRADPHFYYAFPEALWQCYYATPRGRIRLLAAHIPN